MAGGRVTVDTGATRWFTGEFGAALTITIGESFLATLPSGTTLRWSPGCFRVGGEPLLSSESEMESFQVFCLEHRIEFVPVPSG